jgi:hypothetical protein
MSPPPFAPDWTTPPPPRLGGERPIRAWRVIGGGAVALLGHLIVGWFVVVVPRHGAESLNGLPLLLMAQAGLLILCLVPGILLLVRGDRGFGLGLLVGWATGLAALVVTGYALYALVLLNPPG